VPASVEDPGRTTTRPAQLETIGLVIASLGKPSPLHRFVRDIVAVRSRSRMIRPRRPRIAREYKSPFERLRPNG
jgi:hypothetical protein